MSSPTARTVLSLAAALLSASPLLAAGARAAPEPAARPEATLERVEKQLEQSRDREKALGEKAKALAADAERLRRDLVEAAAEAQDTEDRLSSLETQLGDLRTREARLKDELGSRETQMVQVLTAIERLALRPPQAVVVQPMPADDVVRSAILLRAALPQLQDRARVLRGELAALAAVRAEIAQRREDIAVAAKRLEGQKARLAVLLRDKARLQERTEAERAAAARKAARLAEDASSLRDLLARLESERKQREAEAAAEARRLAALALAKPASPAPGAAPGTRPEAPTAGMEARPRQAALPAPRPLEEMRGNLPLPARGRLLTRYGEPDELGATSKGIVIETRPAAQVVAPGDGTVAFAGPFRGYGQLLIIEHGGGYHVLLSGMGRIDAMVGQRLLSGEPVGVMNQSGSPTLYIELRRDGQPINPLPWLTARKG